jgi:quercetin dioxygenase-like cupin family protein
MNDAAAAAGFEAFEAEARADGYTEVLVREWAPGQRVAEHTHPFALRVQVVRGELVLTFEGQARGLRAGERFELPLAAPHAEAYGPEGATFWVARRSSA